MADERDDIRRYLNNEMTSAERHAFEKKAMRDPFLAEALEGAETISPVEFDQDVRRLSKKISRQRPLGLMLSLRIAAGVAIFAAAGWLIFWNSAPDTQPIAEQMADSTLSRKDSALTMLTLAQPEAAESAKERTPAETSPESPRESTKTPPGQTAAAAGPDTSTTDPATAESAAEDVADEQRAEMADRAVTEAETVAATKGASAPQAVTLDRKEKRALKQDAAISEITSPSPAAEGTGAPGFTPASPVGGLAAYQRYLETNRKIPEEAAQAQVHGTVTVDFIISVAGEPGSFTLVKGLGSGCEQELIRLIRSGPKWMPAARNGHPETSVVRVSLEF